MRGRGQKKTRRCAAAIAVVTACAAVVACALPAGAAAKKPASLYWGAQIGAQLTGEQAPWDMGAVQKFQGIGGKGLSLVQFAAPFAECDPQCVFGRFPLEPLEDVRAYGAIPIFSWSSASSPPEVDQPNFRLSSVISGRYDAYIRSFAEAAKAWGHPFFLRFDWEMNGFWFPWDEGINGNQPGEFVAAWRHVHDIFTAVGATNVSWIWCPNVDLHGELIPLGSVYPGNAYVDWTALDGFNWGNRRGSPGWQTFDQVFRRTYHRIVTKVAPKKPMMLSEVASSERGGSKSKWIENMFKVIRNSYGKIRGVVWYDVNDRGTNWPIETNKQVSAAFRRAISPGAFKPNEFGGIAADGPIPPPAR